uniref:Uncharacterized protein n=1 Tax=Phaeomonas parva TaxID=124430 RepID=A0A7S1U6L1_9STRA|mmetsp:Transcript_31609/g.100357  ORF Transcript_31609/g.100357 Transcript_31609/m.100357 type:complete len:272 (+) Transcript_31609:94-909(+)
MSAAVSARNRASATPTAPRRWDFSACDALMQRQNVSPQQWELLKQDLVFASSLGMENNCTQTARCLCLCWFCPVVGCFIGLCLNKNAENTIRERMQTAMNNHRETFLNYNIKLDYRIEGAWPVFFASILGPPRVAVGTSAPVGGAPAAAVVVMGTPAPVVQATPASGGGAPPVATAQPLPHVGPAAPQFSPPQTQTMEHGYGAAPPAYTAPPSYAPVATAPPARTTTVDLRIPEGVNPGDFLQVMVEGRQVEVMVPEIIPANRHISVQVQL